MSTKDFTKTFTVDKSPEEVYAAINNVRDWWTGDIEGNTQNLNDEFTYRYKDIHYSKHKLVEMEPCKKVVWLITDSELNFVKDKTEWNGTKIVFDIEPQGDKTQVRFTHYGLVPEIECYEGCSGAWSGYIGISLKNMIDKGA